MLFLTEQDVKDALTGGDAYKEAVTVIERVLAQQSAGTTHHLKRTTMTHPQHPGHLWHNIRILPGMAPDLVARIDRAVADALKTPEIQERIYGFGLVPNHAPGTQLASTQAEHLKKWEAPIKASGFKAE